MQEYRRHLPHQIPVGVPIFVTWNLKGALPNSVIVRLESERERLLKEPKRAHESIRERNVRHGKLLFSKADHYLDRATSGPQHLKNPQFAKIVEDAILFGALERYALYAWCVMANHVHVLLTPLWVLSAITKGIKGYTSREINRLQERVGRSFWQDESYDHWVRDEDELFRIIAYGENNPVKAGLCYSPERWPWSSARFRSVCPLGQAFHPDMLRGIVSTSARQAGKPDLRC